LRAHFPSSPQTPPVEAILAANIPYLDACTEELLRKGNVIPEIVREAACDAELLGHGVPKGATLVCSTYVAHKPFAVSDAARSPTSRANMARGAIWQPDLDDFHPERWLRADGSFDATALPGWPSEQGRGRVSVRSILTLLASRAITESSCRTDRDDRSKIRDAAVPNLACRDVTEL
jgi:hypothetical protein